jgi:hypothetical protein
MTSKTGATEEIWKEMVTAIWKEMVIAIDITNDKLIGAYKDIAIVHPNSEFWNFNSIQNVNI